MGDGAGDGTQDTFACLATAHEDDDIIRVPNETVSASFEYLSSSSRTMLLSSGEMGENESSTRTSTSTSTSTEDLD